MCLKNSGNVMKCPNCNEEINDDSNFCKFCGFNLNVIEDLPSEKMFCHNCGKLIDNNSEYCTFCGVKVEPIIFEKPISTLLSEAEDNLKHENFNESLNLFNQAYEKDNYNEDALLGLVKSCYQLNDYGNVIVFANKYLKLNKTDINVLNIKLESEIKTKNFFSAKNTVNDLIELSNQDIDLLFKKISILEEINQTAEIIPVYNQILNIDDNRDDIYFKKSKLLFDLSRFRLALKSIDSAIKINPSINYKIFKKEIENKFVKQISNQSFNAALNYFEEHNYLFASEILSNYNDSKSLELRCICLYRMGRNDEALTVVNQLLKVSNDVSFIDLKAKIYMAMGNKANSIKFFKEAVNLNKKYITDLAFAYGRFGDIDSSKMCYSSVKNELSQIWLNYYRESKDLLISGLQNDFFNYPHLICLKINMYIKKAVSFFSLNDSKNTLKYLKLSEKYLFKLKEFIDYYNLNNEFVASNFSYLEKVLEKYQSIDLEKLKYCDKKIFNKFLEISNSILNYYDGSTIHFIKINAFLSNF